VRWLVIPSVPVVGEVCLSSTSWVTSSAGSHLIGLDGPPQRSLTVATAGMVRELPCPNKKTKSFGGHFSDKGASALISSIALGQTKVVRYRQHRTSRRPVPFRVSVRLSLYSPSCIVEAIDCWTFLFARQDPTPSFPSRYIQTRQLYRLAA